ncbi:MAG: VIT1/CCC1 transporter family protein [Methanomicrobiales archaeon]
MIIPGFFYYLMNQPQVAAALSTLTAFKRQEINLQWLSGTIGIDSSTTKNTLLEKEPGMRQHVPGLPTTRSGTKKSDPRNHLSLPFIIPSTQWIQHEVDLCEVVPDMSGEQQGSCISRVKESFRYSFGEIVFGMSDGTVSIFGLVAGMLAGAQSASVILLAGATAAIAATVSMMAGVFLDLESEKDAAKVEAKRRAAEIQSNPEGAVTKLMGDLQCSGLSKTCLDAIQVDLQKNPLAIQKFEDAVAAEEETPAQKTPVYIHACWMGIADFIAAMTPVIPFAFLPVEPAKYACIAGTAVLLLLLGIGRARIGQRPLFRTVLETMAIATAAGIAGVIFALIIT